jgi:hypothetical protein
LHITGLHSIKKLCFRWKVDGLLRRIKLTQSLVPWRRVLKKLIITKLPINNLAFDTASLNNLRISQSRNKIVGHKPFKRECATSFVVFVYSDVNYGCNVYN